MSCCRELERLVALLAAVLVQGCTLIGLTSGAVIDAATPGPYAVGDSRQVQLERGDRVIMVTRRGFRAEGKYVGSLGPTPRDPERYVVVENDDGLIHLPLSEVRSVAVEVTGKGWCYGALTGLALDVLVVVVFALTWDPDYSGMNMRWGA
jgi:hypothetical protein